MLKPSDIANNKTGHFYCDRDCMKIGHGKFYSGENNPFYGKIHSEETLAKISGNNHWNYGRRHSRSETQHTMTCDGCGGEFQASRKRKFCSQECISKYAFPARITRQCGYCGKDVEVIPARSNHKNVFCDETCYSFYRKFIYQQPSGLDSHWFGKRGSVTPNWRGGLSYEPYSCEFGKELKELIRAKDSYTCQLCGVSQNGESLCIHHIDYDKNNNSVENLISLCRKCHGKTNGNREFWTRLFYEITLKREGATTIPQGSTSQANGDGSARHPIL